MFLGRCCNHFAPLLVALAYASIVMIWISSDRAVQIRSRVAAFGRMALTNYIGQSILATCVFYGIGLGWYGYLSRLEQQLVVGVILVAQICLSSWWLKRFRIGPLEWFWRSMTYLRLVPILR